MKQVQKWGCVHDPKWDAFIDWLCGQMLDEDNDEWFNWAIDVSPQYGILIVPCVESNREPKDIYCYLIDESKFLLWQIKYADCISSL